MDSGSKYDLIVSNLNEVLGEDQLRNILKERNLNVYWGTATTGRPHLAYFVPISKIADFLRAECNVTILLADLHAYLDNLKAPWELLKYRTEYYERMIKALFTSIGVPLDRLKFVKGTDYQLDRNFSLDLYRLSSMVTEHDARKAGAEVVKQVEHPLLSSLIYPCLQMLDEEYLKCDAQFGGVDQRKIFTFSEKYLPKLGYSKRIHLMNPMVPGLNGSKMSSSDEESKIDLLDSAKTVQKKVRRAFCEPGNVEENGLLSFCKHVIFPLLRHSQALTMRRSAEHGGDLVFEDYTSLEESFRRLEIHPGDLKVFVENGINALLEPVRQEFSNPEASLLVSRAYPSTSDDHKQMTDAGCLDIRVAQLIAFEKHPSSCQLHVLRVLLGEDRVLTAVTDLAVDELEERVDQSLIVVCNLKPARLQGVTSEALVLCAQVSVPARALVPLAAPPGCTAGERVCVEHCASEVQEEVRGKLWERLRTHFSVDAITSAVVWKGGRLRTDQGCVISPLSGSVIIR